MRDIMPSTKMKYSTSLFPLRLTFSSFVHCKVNWANNLGLNCCD